MEELRHPIGVNKSGFNSRDFTDEAFETAPIVWAMDAFEPDEEIHLRTASALQKLFPLAPVHPIYIMNDDIFADRGYNEFLKPALRPMAVKAMSHLLGEIRFMNYKKPRVLLEHSTTRQASSRKLLRYAEKIGARTIAIGNHGRRGLSRMLNGSFSETVMAMSSIPVLLTGPRSDMLRHRPSTIVFPTDFSPAGNVAFEHILHLAQWLKAEIHLFHKQILIMDPIAQSGMHMFGGGWVSVEAYMNQAPDDHRAEAEAWMQRAEDLSVKTKFISENFREPTSEAIVQYVRSLGDPSAMIAMVSQTGPVASAFLGSVTRDVIRTSRWPIYLAPRPL